MKPCYTIELLNNTVQNTSTKKFYLLAVNLVLDYEDIFGHKVNER